MQKIAEILKAAPKVEVTLKDHLRYLAHIHSSKKPESLDEHIELVNNYFEQLVNVHGLEKLIDNIVIDICKDWKDNEKAADIIKTQFVHIVVFHDFGKVNENFQVLRMKNYANFCENAKTILKPPHGHSFLGTFLFIAYQIDLIASLNISDETRYLLICHCFFLAYSILQHHSPVLTEVLSEDYLASFTGLFDFFEVYIKQYNLTLKKELVTGVFKHITKIWEAESEGNSSLIGFPLFSLIKLNFSLLTAADYLATHEYMNSTQTGLEGKTTDFGVLENRKRIAEIIQHFKCYKHNKDSFEASGHYLFKYPLEKSNDNLNLLRKEMAIEVIQRINENTNSRLFYVEAPTGGGKTNLSMIAVCKLLEADHELNKVYYVFPFTTLITQTFKSVKESFGLKDNDIAELHSKAGFSSKSNEQQMDGIYGDEKKDYIDNLFALYPVTLLSHVKFFDILKTNRKESNYLLHRLANSIVVIDEIQSYNPQIWDKMLYFINEYSKHFNIRFILMSATLPKISGINIGLTQKPTFVELLPNARNYILNKNFSERVTFNFELFKEVTIERLAEEVIGKSNKYASQNGNVRTIIEFIYKKSASGFQQTISKMKHLFDKIFVLSGTILESRRREIINFIKRTSKLKINILLITTQVVEAGVDIDMDIGFKNISLIDSDEQLAGRVNRNGLKTTCEIYLFKLDDARILYGKDYRYQQTRENISNDDYKQILLEKDFKRLYEKVIELIDKRNVPIFKDGFTNYESQISSLRFNKVNDQFKIIDQDNESIFVPLKVPITIEGVEDGLIDEIFPLEQVLFLKQFGVIPTDNKIDGKSVWDIYETLINNRIQKQKSKNEFDIKAKIDFKILQNIMSKFTFSLMMHSKDYEKIKIGFGEEKFGYMYFSYWNEERTNGKAYSYNDGLNNNAFSDSNFI